MHLKEENDNIFSKFPEVYPEVYPEVRNSRETRKGIIVFLFMTSSFRSKMDDWH